MQEYPSFYPNPEIIALIININFLFDHSTLDFNHLNSEIASRNESVIIQSSSYLILKNYSMFTFFNPGTKAGLVLSSAYCTDLFLDFTSFYICQNLAEVRQLLIETENTGTLTHNFQKVSAATCIGHYQEEKNKQK